MRHAVAFMFENLEVYQKAVDFADHASALAESFPRGYYFLANQLSRAALSIATNLAEGNGRFTKADRKNFFGIARGSAQECVPLLELARRRKLLDDARHAEMREELETIAKMLSGLINGLDKRETLSSDLLSHCSPVSAAKPPTRRQLDRQTARLRPESYSG